jgi:hypothetical protein
VAKCCTNALDILPTLHQAVLDSALASAMVRRNAFEMIKIVEEIVEESIAT